MGARFVQYISVLWGGWLAFSFSVSPSNVAAQSAFKLWGEVELSNAPTNVINADHMIHVWAGSSLRERLDVKESQFNGFYAIDLIGEQFRIDAILDGFVQKDPISFKPKDLIGSQNDKSVYQYVYMVRLSDILHANLQEAEKLLDKNDSYKKIIPLLDGADSYAITIRSLFIRARAVRAQIGRDENAVHDLTHFIATLRYRPGFENCFDIIEKCPHERFDTIILEFADTLMDAPDLNFRISATRTILDEIVQLYSLAIHISPDQPRGYQGKYIAEMRSEYFLDSYNTITLFFENNPNLKRSSTIRSFLTDLGTSVEKLTLDENLASNEQQRDKICENDEILTIWRSLHKVLHSNRRHYARKSNNKITQRLQNLQEFSDFIVACGGELWKAP